MTGRLGIHKKIFNNNSGIALLVTLAVIFVLLTAALYLARITGESVMATGKETDDFIAREMALSGIHLAMAILADDAAKNEIDSVQEDWANPKKISEAVGQLGFTQGKLLLTITDELGKLQVNALLQAFPGHELNRDQQLLWENFLSTRIAPDKSEDPRDVAAIINSLKDWLDSGDDDAVTGLSGAESDYYLGLESPHACGNGPFNQVSELLNVKGITPALLDIGTKEEPPTDEPLKKALEFSDVFTVYGMAKAPLGAKTYGFPGKININTAGIDVLAALFPRGMEDLAQDLIDFREETAQDGTTFINLLDKGWYERVIEFSEQEKKRFDRMIRYASNYFEAKSTAKVNDTEVVVSAYIIREQNKKTNQWGCRILQLTRD
ncbi:MAG: general secretion pathway protein GspK [Proteobacteria bacterium]|nr:general secretion pathway protein GspK [Desulfobacula sp.]MBU3953353.1 general secretion pathway protein GspK [Pseudomonadota bacterium]MBU4131356.1 general secretion pathway protein GspK [Pseudomonadota bacterium]